MYHRSSGRRFKDLLLALNFFSFFFFFFGKNHTIIAATAKNQFDKKRVIDCHKKVFWIAKMTM